MVASPLCFQISASLVLDELQKGFNKKKVLVRVIHFWEARNVKKGGLLMGLELLLIDQKSTLIHAFISANRIGYYEANLKADKVYKIKKFVVIDNKNSYRLSSHKFLIQFTQQTTLVSVPKADHTIKRQRFRIQSYEEFKKAVDMNEDLYDAIGKIVLINNDNFNYPILTGKSHGVDNVVTKSKIDVHLQLKDGPIVRVTLWGNVAANFQKKIMESANKPVVFLVTTVNPRTFRDMFCLSSTSSTRIIFDKDVEPSFEYLTWLGESGNNSINSSDVASFYCIATIVDILSQYGWYYIACPKCKCKLGRSDTTLVCNTCNHKNTVGLIRYRVELTVYDKDNVATFVIFDDDTTKLIGRKAADIMEADVHDDENGAIDNHSSTPQCLFDVVGRTYKFQVKLKPFDFTATRQTITVTSIHNKIVDDKIYKKKQIHLTLLKVMECAKMMAKRAKTMIWLA